MLVLALTSCPTIRSNRLETLFQFVQSIYLMFAAVYVLKESIEHALLAEEFISLVEYEIELPFWMLLLACVCTLITGLFLHTHSKLVDGECFFSRPLPSRGSNRS